MDMKNIIISAIVVAAVGLVIAIVLSIAERYSLLRLTKKSLPFVSCSRATTAVPAVMQAVMRLQKQLLRVKHLLRPARRQVSRAQIKLHRLWALRQARLFAKQPMSGARARVTTENRIITISERKPAKALKLRSTEAKCPAATAVSATAAVLRYATIMPCALLTARRLLKANCALPAVSASRRVRRS